MNAGLYRKESRTRRRVDGSPLQIGCSETGLHECRQRGGIKYMTTLTPFATVQAMANLLKRRALQRHRALNSTPEAVSAELFRNQPEFFDRDDKLQVRYEMLRGPAKGEMNVTQACKAFGVTRQTFYRIKRAFEAEGVTGLADRKRGRKGPLKATFEVMEFLQRAKAEDSDRSGSELARMVSEQFGIQLHRRTVERLVAQKKKPPGEGTS